jgi:hypothetical protein
VILERCPAFALDGRQTEPGAALWEWWATHARPAPFSRWIPRVCSSCGRSGPTVGSHDLCQPCARLDALIDAGRL